MLAYPRLREADVFWSKRYWRLLDQDLGGNSHLDRAENPLALALTQALLKGVLSAYAPSEGGEAFYGEQLRVDQLAALLAQGRICSCQVQVAEDWLMDEGHSLMDVRVLALGLLKADPQSGECRQEELLAWVPFTAARAALGDEVAIPQSATSAELSWDDVLTLRRFDSRILKQSNVLDQSISDYARGVEAVEASRTMEQQLQEFEQSLWPQR